MSEAELMAIAHRAYVGGLVLVCALALFHKRADFKRARELVLSLSPLRRTAVAIALNWGVNTAFVLATDIRDPWFWFIGTDALAAAVILYQPAGKPQSVIGGLYMAQIVMHGVYGVLKLQGEPIAENGYWLVLTALAFVQLLVLGGWSIGYHGGRLARNRGLRGGPAVARGKSGKGVAG